MKFLRDLTEMLKKKSALMLSAAFSFLAASVATAQEAAAEAPAWVPDSGDTAWVLTSAALVLLMTPGLALFYGGMVRRKNVMSTIMQCFFLIALISVQWVIFGYSLAFSEGNKFLGGLSWMFLKDIPPASSLAGSIPHSAFVMFQAMFAIITPALICGAFAERIKFKGFVLFSLLWATFVYDPMCHMVWGGGLFGSEWKAMDFAGGTVVHMSSGFSALTLALLLGARKGYGKENMLPHNLPFVLLGASLLWFGWFGFNAGSAVASGQGAADAFLTTNTATAIAVLVWCLLEAIHKGKATSLGAASGAVAGLVAITPACGYVDVVGSLWVGGIAGLVCYLAIQLKLKLGYDDSLDAFGIHGIGGAWGALATGIWALSPNVENQFMVQLKTVVVTAVFCVVATTVIFFIVDKLVGMRVEAKDEEVGLDLSQHGEEGYAAKGL